MRCADSSATVPFSIAVPNALLCSRNAVFRAMLSSNMEESVGGKIILTAPSSSFVCAFVSLVVYAICGIFAVRAEDVFEVLQLSSEYEFVDLKRQCEDVLCRQLDISNLTVLIPYAEAYDLQKLSKCCVGLMLKHYSLFSQLFRIRDSADVSIGASCVKDTVTRWRNDPTKLFNRFGI
jgi:hypothetical protein